MTFQIHTSSIFQSIVVTKHLSLVQDRLETMFRPKEKASFLYIDVCFVSGISLGVKFGGFGHFYLG